MNTMIYKGYIALIQYSEADGEFFGAVINTSRDKIYFGGKTVDELQQNMQEAIEGHIQNCKQIGIQPEKTYSGRITYRTTPQQHARLVQASLQSGLHNVNAWIDEVLRREAEKILTSS